MISRLVLTFCARLVAIVIAIVISVVIGGFPPLNAKLTSSGIALHGAPKYPADFDHFDYAEPNAPKGGTLRLAAVGRFDNLNPFILKGVAAAGLDYLFETLMSASADESMSQYPLIAQAIDIAPDGSSVTFTLRSTARFHDGTAIQAEDVVFSFDILMQEGHPFYRSYFQQVEKATALDSQTVRFDFRGPPNRELPFIVGTGIPVLSQAWWSKRKFGKTMLQPPMGSGPYQIENVDHPRVIQYARVENYWGKDLPVNRGRYNFDRIHFDYFRDNTVALEAFKSGEYDFRFENQAKAWATAYDFPAVQEGLVVVEMLDHEMPSGMQGFVFNTRKDMFADPKVRQALTLAYDFEWANRNLFHSTYERSHSYFSNSELESSATPSESERSLLEPWQDRIPKEVFTTAYRSPSTLMKDEDSDVQASIRGLRVNLRKALHLLVEAGWTIHEDGVLRNKDGTAMQFEILIRNPQFERVAAPYIRNLERLGIKANMRILQDDSQYQGRMDRFDFDMNVGVFPSSLSPGNELVDTWKSSSATTPGSRNIAGVRDPAVDAMIEHVLAARNRKDLKTAVQALDRLLLWGYYVVPHWHLGKFRVAWWKKFSRPNILPLYTFTLDFWWWDAEKIQWLEARKNILAHQDKDSSFPLSTTSTILVLLSLGVLFVLFRRRSRKE